MDRVEKINNCQNCVSLDWERTTECSAVQLSKQSRNNWEAYVWFTNTIQWWRELDFPTAHTSICFRDPGSDGSIQGLPKLFCLTFCLIFYDLGIPYALTWESHLFEIEIIGKMKKIHLFNAKLQHLHLSVTYSSVELKMERIQYLYCCNFRAQFDQACVRWPQFLSYLHPL